MTITDHISEPHIADHLTEPDGTDVEAFAGRLFEASLQGVELLDIALGAHLGLYDALAATPVTPGELSTRAGIGERYAQEWLEQQAVAGVLEVDDPSLDPGHRRFRLPAAHRHVLLERDSEAHMLPLIEALVVAATWLPMLEDAYRSGRGVPYSHFAVHDVQAGFSRPAFKNHLVQDWLPALGDVHAGLVAGTARVAEIGCGEGVAAVTIAQAFPLVRVDGFDLDDASIAAARALASEAGVADRVRFEVADGREVPSEDRYDLVMCVEVLHDASDPVGLLGAMRRMRSERGAVLVVDERTGERFEAPGDPIERLLYAFSTLHCLPAGMAQQPSAATGTVMRPDTLRGYARAAGFSAVSELPVEHPQLRLYRLDG